MLIKKLQGGRCNPEFAVVIAAAFLATMSERHSHFTVTFDFCVSLLQLSSKTTVCPDSSISTEMQKKEKAEETRESNLPGVKPCNNHRFGDRTRELGCNEICKCCALSSIDRHSYML